MFSVLIIAIPVVFIFLLVVPGSYRIQKRMFYFIQSLNILSILFPPVLAFFMRPEGESMWNENTGSGAYMLLYIFIIPFAILTQIVLFMFKPVRKSAQNEKDI